MPAYTPRLQDATGGLLTLLYCLREYVVEGYVEGDTDPVSFTRAYRPAGVRVDNVIGVPRLPPT